MTDSHLVFSDSNRCIHESYGPPTVHNRLVVTIWFGLAGLYPFVYRRPFI